MQSAGAYSLGPRAMLELHPYLKRVYEDDIVHCMMCHEITIKVSINLLHRMCNFFFNPLSPSIKLQILFLYFYTILTEVVGRSC